VRVRAAFAGVLIGLALGGAALAPPSNAQPAPDLARAKDLYLAGEKAMADGRFDDAIRDFGATFDITRDPILFYKIASAHQKAGKCDVALIYYGRYVKEARPTDRYLELTKERVKECGGDVRAMPHSGAPEPGPGSAGSATAAGSNAEPRSGSNAGSAAASATAGTTADSAALGPGSADPGSGPGDGSATVTGVGSGSAAPGPGLGRHRAAWLLVTTGIAFVTVGSVLAYSANSAESDISDLYQGFTGTPSEFDDKTRATYDDLVAEGRRYERLSWLSFGLAGATAIGAIVLFKTGAREKPIAVTPTASPDGAGVRATLRW